MHFVQFKHADKSTQQFSLEILSDAFLRSIKHVQTSLAYSQDFSNTFWRVKI